MRLANSGGDYHSSWQNEEGVWVPKEGVDNDPRVLQRRAAAEEAAAADNADNDDKEWGD